MAKAAVQAQAFVGAIEWKVTKAKVGDLIGWVKNPRRISAHDKEQLQVGLGKFGLAQALVVNRDKRSLIGGHQRAGRIVDAYGPEQVVSISYPHRELTAEEFEELGIRLNRNAGEWDYELLGEFDPGNLQEWGFTDWEVARPDDEEVTFGDFKEDGEEQVAVTHTKQIVVLVLDSTQELAIVKGVAELIKAHGWDARVKA